MAVGHISITLSSVIPGNKSLMSDRNSGSSWSTNLERFMSRRPRMTIVGSVSLGFALFEAPSVLNTERMLRRPKS